MTTLEISVCFKFVMLEEKSRSSYDNFGSGSVVTFPEDSIQTIYDAARSLIAKGLSIHENVVTIDNLCLYEVRLVRNVCLILHERFAVEKSIREAIQEIFEDGAAGTWLARKEFDHHPRPRGKTGQYKNPKPRLRVQ